MPVCYISTCYILVCHIMIYYITVCYISTFSYRGTGFCAVFTKNHLFSCILFTVSLSSCQSVVLFPLDLLILYSNIWEKINPLAITLNVLTKRLTGLCQCDIMRRGKKILKGLAICACLSYNIYRSREMTRGQLVDCKRGT